MSGLGFGLVVLAALLTMSANLLLRSGIDRVGGFTPDSLAALPARLAGLFLQPLFTMGFTLYFAASLVWFRVVGSEPLSVAYPLLVTLTFTLVTAGAILVFREPLTVRKLLGLLLILGGIVMISRD